MSSEPSYSMDDQLNNGIYVQQLMSILNKRERYILDRISRGFRLSEIAENLDISSTRVSQIRDKARNKIKGRALAPALA